MVLLITALTSAVAGQEPKIRRHALLVGIGDYPAVSEWQTLEGPVDDVAAMKSVLIDRGGFEEQFISTLTDAQATKQAILDGLENLIERAAPNDLVLFFFAGHGSWADDIDGDEIQDGADETLVPYDAADRSGAERDILDDQIRAFITKANLKTSNVVLIFDCCCSGTAVRGTGIVSRQVPPDSIKGRGIAGRRPGRGPDGVVMNSAPLSFSPPARSTTDDTPRLNYVALAACRAEESAAELRVNKTATTRRGLFTWTLVKNLREAKPGMTYSELMDQVSSGVKTVYARQTPALEGSLRHQTLFAGGVPLHRNFFSMQSEAAAEGNNGARGAEGGGSELITISAGQVHGMMEGDQLVVCPVGTLSPADAEETLGTLKVISVGVTTSIAEWQNRPPAAEHLKSARIFMWKKAPRARSFTVSISSPEQPIPPKYLDEILTAAKRFPDLRLSTEPDGNLSLELENGQWQLKDYVGLKLPVAGKAGRTDEVFDLLRRLDHLGHAARVKGRTQNPNVSSLQFETKYEKHGRDADNTDASTPQELAEGVAQIQTTDLIRASITNQNEFPIYASLILFSPDGDIYVLATCETEDDLIPAGNTKRVEQIELYAPPTTVPFYKNQNCVLRWVVTRKWHDVRPLEQGPVTASTRSGDQRGPSDGASSKMETSPIDAWATDALELRLLVGEPAGNH